LLATVTAWLVAEFENRQPGTIAKFINKVHCLFYCLALFVRLELKLTSERKGENIFVAHHTGKPKVSRMLFLSVRLESF
jgi:hypothetical protein